MINEDIRNLIAFVFVICVFGSFFIGVLAMIAGYIFLILKKEIGEILMKLGADCGVIGFSLILVAASGSVLLVVLIAYWLIWQKMRKPKIKLCPNCGNQISGGIRRSLFRSFGLRRATLCQNCGVNIILSKWPWRLIIISLSLFLILLFLILFSVDLGYGFNVIFYTSLSLLLIGHFTLKLEYANTRECSTPKT
jgi:predicted RNA-binding Zn-ribbon protein involved in translation (DUF1610 family)